MAVKRWSWAAKELEKHNKCSDDVRKWKSVSSKVTESWVAFNHLSLPTSAVEQHTDTWLPIHTVSRGEPFVQPSSVRAMYSQDTSGDTAGDLCRQIPLRKQKVWIIGWSSKMKRREMDCGKNRQEKIQNTRLISIFGCGMTDGQNESKTCSISKSHKHTLTVFHIHTNYKHSSYY